jgi:hypothetical protein
MNNSEDRERHNATIAAVRGRDSSREPGLSPIHSMTLDLGEDGLVEISRVTNPNAVTASVTILDTAAPKSFDRCPICLEPNPTSKEHVPPESVGGAVMTLTCLRCNNDLGSRVEADLTAWCDDSMMAWFANDSVPGKRRLPPLLIRQTKDGNPVLVMAPGGMDSAIPAMLDRGGEIEATYRLPDMDRVTLAILKSAFLASCLFLDDLPETELSAAIRKELLEVRDRSRKEPLTLGPMAVATAFGKLQGADPKPGEVALVLFTPPGKKTPELYISLARVILVRWPLERISPKPEWA